MARPSNQKLKLLRLAKIFETETDERHALRAQELIARLADYGIPLDRKTLYQDLESLRDFGMDIVAVQDGRSWRYYLGERDFELPELKLLVDSVQSAKFITARKSEELIHKLEGLTSRYDAHHLQRQVLLSGRVKMMNESIYYNVDSIHEAIGAGRQIRFHYFRWNVKKEPELRRDGAWYQVSPWGLLWDDENYYLVAYDEEDARIKHYRVDKMLHLSVTDEPRVGRGQFETFDLTRYSRALFGMFGGEETSVTLEGENALAGVLIDRFGKDLRLIPKDADHFTARVDVAVSRQFLGWVFGLGPGIRITGPESVTAEMKKEAERLIRQYP